MTASGEEDEERGGGVKSSSTFTDWKNSRNCGCVYSLILDGFFSLFFPLSHPQKNGSSSSFSFRFLIPMILMFMMNIRHHESSPKFGARFDTNSK